MNRRQPKQMQPCIAPKNVVEQDFLQHLIWGILLALKEGEHLTSQQLYEIKKHLDAV